MLEVDEIFNFNSIIEWDSIRTPILVGILVVFGSIGVTIKCLFIKYFVRHAPPNRPINSMMLKEQVLNLASTLVMGFGNLIPLVTGVPLYNHFGEVGCFFFRCGLVLFTFVSFISGFCMALFRYILTIHNAKVLKLGVDRVKKMINITEAVLYCWACLCSGVIYVYGSSPMTMSFCRNQSKAFLNTLTEHTNKTNVGHLALSMMSIFCLALGILEIVMYIRLYRVLYKKNKTMERSMSKEVVQYRAKRNAMTLTGQVWVFVVELIAYTIVQVTVNMDVDSPFLQAQMATFYAIMMSSIVSVGHFIASPDMRRFYWNLQY